MDLCIKFLLDLTFDCLSSSLRRDVYNLNCRFIKNLFVKLKEISDDDVQIENLLKCLEEFIRVVNQKESLITSLSNHFSSIKIDKFDLKIQMNESLS